ncbi:dTDP-4-amino-4,6-dideoxygalactose transaminase [Pseudoalteromonas arctica]|jgi:dTDP-4-amino-4,6-dideoxygalactose transaminase|uniref:dTDP-4-amino-4,6-dideoxygalactose transaminase n=1 Tax=Pseudoalteromonas arctica TaxID=394751 RepID=A0A7X9U5V2_9GAMM|nr:dTDP-4-amino-4,6-dideoxygalactose transaminase [Pseudoalteromonas arctica]NMF48124.1 dTDP-4-amino-4,6-dideoxygalactose transaminase [Pseudoalteromonas arctica]
MIPFNTPLCIGNEKTHVLTAIESGKLCGDGPYGKKCQQWFEKQLGARKTLLTPSCTHALELAAILIDIKVGDEVIMPSYTFVSTANPFVLRGAKVVFVDIRQDTMNIDEQKIEAAITDKTKAIIPVHYAGVGCDMDKIMLLADKYNLWVVEDAAQGMMSSYKGKALGTIGHLGAFSFHETKNYTSGGEGGLLIINDDKLIQRAEVVREKGTNRSLFFRGMVDKYSWVDVGSSYLPSELQAAYLFGQLEKAHEVNQARLATWEQYYSCLSSKALEKYIVLPCIPSTCEHNAHMFYIKAKNLEERSMLISYLKENDVMSVFHYIPLHSAIYGLSNTMFHGDDDVTTKDSERLLRLPMWYGISSSEITKISDLIHEFYGCK